MREAFLIHMNDFEFERLLEIKLRQLLDPVVAAPAPPRKRPGRRTEQSPALIEMKLVAERVVAVPVEVFA